MNRVSLISLGVLGTVLASLFGLVLIPDWQLGGIEPKEITARDGSVSMYPQRLDDYREASGEDVYREMGCIYCHSQQVRPQGFGADIERGWGQRRSVPLDYVLQDPPYFGTMRTGPDLANIGFRQPSVEWHLLHLYDPQITSSGSVMPPFRFLFDLHRGNKPATPAGVPVIRLPEGYAEEPSWIVPGERALQLVAYLKSLQQPHDLETVQ